MQIGIIGLGNMGSGMAANLQAFSASQNQSLWVFDLDAEKVATQTARGAQAADSVEELVGKVDVLLTSLPSAVQVNAIAPVVFEHGSQGLTWLETSTNDLGQWQKILDAAPAHMTLIDAPITGGYEGARDGTLTMLMGADEAQVEPLRPMLDAMTKKALVMGPSGAGYITKLAQLHLNYLVAQGIGEALMLGAKGGLDLAQLHDVFMNSCAQSYVVDAYIPRVLDGSYDPSFALGLALKDMRLVNDLGAHLGVDLELGQQVLSAYDDATDRYGFDAPHLSILKRIEEASGQTLRTPSDS